MRGHSCLSLTARSYNLIRKAWPHRCAEVAGSLPSVGAMCAAEIASIASEMVAKPCAADPPGEDERIALRAHWVDEVVGPAAAGFPPNVRFPLLVAIPLEQSSDPVLRTKLVAIARSGRSRSPLTAEQ